MRNCCLGRVAEVVERVTGALVKGAAYRRQAVEQVAQFFIDLNSANHGLGNLRTQRRSWNQINRYIAMSGPVTIHPRIQCVVEAILCLGCLASRFCQALSRMSPVAECDRPAIGGIPRVRPQMTGSHRARDMRRDS